MIKIFPLNICFHLTIGTVFERKPAEIAHEIGSITRPSLAVMASSSCSAQMSTEPCSCGKSACSFFFY